MITGFPSPAQGYESKGIDLNSVLIRHPSATVFMQIESSSYMNMGIYNGDILIIDRAKKITPNSLVVYESEGHFVLGRVYKIKKSLEDTIITGAITHVIHTVREMWFYTLTETVFMHPANRFTVRIYATSRWRFYQIMMESS